MGLFGAFNENALGLAQFGIGVKSKMDIKQ